MNVVYQKNRQDPNVHNSAKNEGSASRYQVNPSHQISSARHILNSQHQFNEIASIDELNIRPMFSIHHSELLRIIKTASHSKKEQAICFKRDDGYTFSRIEKNSTMGTFSKLGLTNYSMDGLLDSFKCDIIIKFPDESLQAIHRAAEGQNAPAIVFNYLEGELEQGIARLLVRVNSKCSIYHADLKVELHGAADTDTNLAEQIDLGFRDIPTTNQMVMNRQQSRSKMISETGSCRLVLNSEQAGVAESSCGIRYPDIRQECR